MSIFQSRAATGAQETPESLAELLANAEKQRKSAVYEANLVYEADKAYVFEQAKTRLNYARSIVETLETEIEELVAILFPEGTDSLDDQA